MNGTNASVTTYGFEPIQTAPGQYRFSLYYDAYATDADIDQKADETVEEIRMRNQHDSCSFTRSPMVSPIRVKEIHVQVSCDSQGELTSTNRRFSSH